MNLPCPHRRWRSGLMSLIGLNGLILAATCAPGAATSTATPGAAPPRVANLRAFARLYGVLRWFYPSDAAAAVDWDQFAIDGVRHIVDVPDARSRRSELARLISPFAPTVHFAAAGEDFPDDPALHPPPSATPVDLVAWEHNGYGDSLLASIYASKRRHRDRLVPVPGHPYGALWQAVDATPYRGMPLRLRGRVRTASTARGQLWVRVERRDAVVFSDDMRDRQVVSRTWQPAEIVGPVDPDATRIIFGILSSGNGATWYDDLELATQSQNGSWAQIEISDPGFESEDPLVGWHPGLAKSSIDSIDGWKVVTDRDNPAFGSSSLRVEPITQLASEELFSDSPRAGETFDVDLGDGLRARVPIALYSIAGHTVGDAASASDLPPEHTRTVNSTSGFDSLAGIADVIVAWNVLEHFWPYWQTVSIDWMAALDAALYNALDDRTIDDHVATLQRLSAAAPDGHARVVCPGVARRANPAFTVDVIEGQVVVTATADPMVMRGDTVISIDGLPAIEQLARDEAVLSGSPQFRRVRACRQFGAGPVGSKVALRVRRDGAESNVSVARSDKTAEEFSHPAIERFADDVYYIDLSRTSMAELDAQMERIATAPGVVFDVRRRPNSTHPILSHLLTRPDDAKWLAVARIIRPGHSPSSISGWDTDGWEMKVRQPHIAGRVAFLTGPTAVSYAESVMGLVDYYRMGEIVGRSTAGTNGNLAQIAEPSGCSTTFTGQRVTKSDGSQFHLVGIQPTIPASRTIAGVRAGRDEVLEKALVYVRTGAK